MVKAKANSVKRAGRAVCGLLVLGTLLATFSGWEMVQGDHDTSGGAGRSAGGLHGLGTLLVVMTAVLLGGKLWGLGNRALPTEIYGRDQRHDSSGTGPDALSWLEEAEPSGRADSTEGLLPLSQRFPPLRPDGASNLWSPQFSLYSRQNTDSTRSVSPAIGPPGRVGVEPVAPPRSERVASPARLPAGTDASRPSPGSSLWWPGSETSGQHSPSTGNSGGSQTQSESASIVHYSTVSPQIRSWFQPSSWPRLDVNRALDEQSADCWYWGHYLPFSHEWRGQRQALTVKSIPSCLARVSYHCAVQHRN